MAQVSLTQRTAPTRVQGRLRAAAAPTNAFVNSDYLEAFFYNQCTLMVGYTKGNTTALVIRPEYSLGLNASGTEVDPEAAGAIWFVPVSSGTTATTGSTTTVTVNRVQYRYVHGGTLTTDVDNYAIEIPINTRFFRVAERVATGVGSAGDPLANDTLTGSPSVYTDGMFMRT